ncbi:type II toxin-antitoxin system VapC family toxin [Hymenobacter terricola]|uniref:type II toxin-antitoxin system VapC family toxin n=1 Tax=Hymenobacter terricola TaxID=2819236 RepID=UPI001B30203E|nr:type II toxin-antitoxin system VapC family toxin [Hymenobacter terricola]
MAYLLDSNLLIYSADAAHAFLRPLVQDPANYGSAVSQVETLGFHRLVLADKFYLESIFTLLGVLPVSQPIIERATVLRQQQRMTLGDALIAATALEYGLAVATRNMSDFTPVVVLSVYNPFVS